MRKDSRHASLEFFPPNLNDGSLARGYPSLINVSQHVEIILNCRFELFFFLVLKRNMNVTG